MGKVVEREPSEVDAALAQIQGKVLQQGGAYILDEDDGKVAMMLDEPAASEAYKRRIVAAFNACAGIDLRTLRALGVGGLAALLSQQVPCGTAANDPASTAPSTQQSDHSDAPASESETLSEGFTNRP